MHILEGISLYPVFRNWLCIADIKYYKTFFLWYAANHSFTKSPRSPHELLSSVTEHRPILLRLSGCVKSTWGGGGSRSKYWLCLKVHTALIHSHRHPNTILAKPEDSTSLIFKSAVRDHLEPVPSTSLPHNYCISRKARRVFFSIYCFLEKGGCLIFASLRINMRKMMRSSNC
jgi:hypothetical protein